MKHGLILLLVFLLAGCQSAYYGAMEKVGVHKRDILVSRIKSTLESQQDGQQQFKDALEQYRSVVSFDGGDLETQYNKLDGEYQDSVQASEDISDHINDVERVAKDLFVEWEKELELIGNASLRRDSATKLRQTKQKYQGMILSMRRAERSIKPVLSTLRDQVLYLKHNLNARAISALKGELNTINTDVNRLVATMQRSIDEANAFIQQMQ